MSASKPRVVYCATPSRMHKNGCGCRVREFVRDSGRIPFYLHDERAIEAADEFWVFGLSKEVLVKLKHALRCGKPVYLLYLEFDDDWRLHREEVLIPALNMLDAINLPVYAELRDEIELHFLF